MNTFFLFLFAFLVIQTVLMLTCAVPFILLHRRMNGANSIPRFSDDDLLGISELGGLFTRRYRNETNQNEINQPQPLAVADLPKPKKTKDEREESNRAYDIFLKERYYLRDKRYKIIEEHDKQLLTLSTGALGVFITFVKTIVPEPFPGTMILLAMSWISFGATIVIVLLSSSASEKVFLLERRNWDIEYDTDNRPERSEIEKINNSIEKANRFALISFVSGFVFQAAYIMMNSSFKH